MADASTYLCKYASILVLDRMNYEVLLPLMMLRQNIYTDPQKPIQVEPKVYPIGEPGPDSPVLVTTNFSLTYFLVSGEIENSGVPAHLVIVETRRHERADRLGGGQVLRREDRGRGEGQRASKSSVRTRRIIIPGYVAQISGELEEALPGWEVLVGPGEAADLGSVS